MQLPSRPTIIQFGKFVVIGFANAAVDFAVLYLLIIVTGKATDGPYALFKTVSFLVATGHSYFWNKFWTFRAGTSNGGMAEALRFIGVATISAVINVSVASLVVYSGPRAGFSPIEWAGIGALFGTLASLMFSFLGYRLFVFKKK
jgi:putative flippase GtrA